MVAKATRIRERFMSAMIRSSLGGCQHFEPSVRRQSHARRLSGSTHDEGHRNVAPSAIRPDNGVPFASGNALVSLTRLSTWWLRSGISLQRIKPGHPEQNGRHERMQPNLKQ